MDFLLKINSGKHPPLGPVLYAQRIICFGFILSNESVKSSS